MLSRQFFTSPIAVVGEFTLFGLETVRSCQRLWRRRGIFFRQCEFIGVNSLGVITVAALFLGGVMGFQLLLSFEKFGAQALLGGAIGRTLFRELAPVMAAIMVTGRAGAAIAAEIATMRISEQIDALEVMAVNPIEYLVSPRVVAGLLMLPVLGTYFSVVGSFAGAGVACGIMDLDPSIFWQQYYYFVDPIDIIHCVVKSSIFGLILTWIACFCGYRAQGGARSVGLATRTTVVASCLGILLSDYLLTSVLPFGMGDLTMN